MAKTRRIGLWAAVVVGALFALPTLAQPGGFDPQQFRQQMNDRIKQMLGATDEEYQALQPKIEKVMDLQRQSRFGGMGMMFRGGGGAGAGGGGGGGAGRFGGDPNAQPSAIQTAQRDLQTTLENKDAKPDEIKAKLATLRDAREKAKKDLTGAQGELKELLTQRQEAVMVMMGFLE